MRLVFGEPPGIGELRGANHVVTRQERLHHDPSAPCPRSDQPSGAGEQRHRPLGGPVARRQDLAVEIEERHDVGRRDPVQDRFGADVHAGRRRRVGVGTGDRDRRTTGGGGELLAQPRHPGTQVGKRRRTALEAHGGPCCATPAARQLGMFGVTGIPQRDSTLATLAAGDGSTLRDTPGAEPDRSC